MSNSLKITACLLTFLSFVACSKSKDYYANYGVDIINNSGITFKYSLGDTVTSNGSTSISLNCLVVNNSEKDVYYLQQTCNKLEYFLVPKPDSYVISPEVMCYATFPEILQLKKGDSLKFQSSMTRYEGTKSFEKLGIDFRVLYTLTPLDSLNRHYDAFDNVYRIDQKPSNIIWGQSL